MVDIFPSSALASAAHRSWPSWRERYLIRTDLNAVSSTRTRKNGSKGIYEHRMKNPSDLCLEKYPCESSACVAYKTSSKLKPGPLTVEIEHSNTSVQQHYHFACVRVELGFLFLDSICPISLSDGEEWIFTSQPYPPHGPRPRRAVLSGRSSP
jgi:hypothetical protein